MQDSSSDNQAVALIAYGFSPANPDDLEVIRGLEGGNMLAAAMQHLAGEYSVDGSSSVREDILRGLVRSSDQVFTSKVTENIVADGHSVRARDTAGRAAEQLVITAARAREFTRNASGMFDQLSSSLGVGVLNEEGIGVYEAALARGDNESTAMRAVVRAGAGMFADGHDSVQRVLHGLIGAEDGASLSGSMSDSTIEELATAAHGPADAATTDTSARDAYISRLRADRDSSTPERIWASIGRGFSDHGEFTDQEIATVGALMGSAAVPVQTLMRGAMGGRGDQEGMNVAIQQLFGSGSNLMSLAESFGMEKSGETTAEDAAAYISQTLQGEHGESNQARSRQNIMARALSSGLLRGDALEDATTASRKKRSEEAMIHLDEQLSGIIKEAALVVRVQTPAEQAAGADPAAGAAMPGE